MPDVGVRGSEALDGVEDERARDDEARRAFRVPVEAGLVEARRARVVEVLAPRERGDHLPERTVRVAVALDADVAVPDALAGGEPLGHERERVGREPDAAVEQQHPLAGGGLEPGAPGFEAAPVRLRDDAEREPVGHGGARDVRAAVGRAVVDEDELRVEAAPRDRLRQRVDRRGEVGGLVVNGHDDAERRPHRACVHRCAPAPAKPAPPLLVSSVEPTLIAALRRRQSRHLRFL